MCFVLTPFHFSPIILSFFFFSLKSHVMNAETISQILHILIVLTVTYFFQKKKRKIIGLYFASFFISIIYQLSSNWCSKIANAISAELFYVGYTSASAIRNREGISGKELKLTRRALKISTRTNALATFVWPQINAHAQLLLRNLHEITE